MASLTPTPKFQFINAAGEPLFLGRLYSYAAGTDTPLNTYTDSTGNTANTNPVILDEYGSANVWLGSSLYKLVLKDSSDSTIWTVNNVGGGVTLAQLAGTGTGQGAYLIGFKQSGTGSVDRTVQTKLGDDVTVWDKIPEAQAPDIVAGTSSYDTASALSNVASVRQLVIPEGYFPIASGVDITKGIQGRSAKYSVIKPTTNTFDAVSLTDTTADFQQVADISVIYPSVGTGRGIVLEGNNNNVEVNRCNVQYALRGFSADFVAFMQRYEQCRADFCTTGFYAQGLTNVGTGAGTTLIYDQCYVTNGPGTGTGWNLNNIRTVTMIQPTADVTGLTNTITCTGIGQLNILDHHFEGTPGGNGSYINYTTSGSLSAGMLVMGGALEIVNLTGLTCNYLNIQANDDKVRVVLIGVNVRNFTAGTTSYLAKLSGLAGSHIEIIAINCDFGGLEGRFDTSTLSGTWNYRRIDKELTGPDAVKMYDDFVGDVLADEWNSRVGTDPQVVAPAIRANQFGGVMRMVTGDDGVFTMAVNGVQIEGATNFKAENGLLTFETKVLIASLTTQVCLYVGLTDQNAVLEMPFELAAGDILTSNATDAVGVLYDTAADTDQWCLVGVANDVDATKQFTGFAPSSGTYETWRVQVTSTGVATFYRNGIAVGTTMTGAVTPTVLLCPVIAAFSRGAAIRNIDADYILTECKR